MSATPITLTSLVEACHEWVEALLNPEEHGVQSSIRGRVVSDVNGVTTTRSETTWSWVRTEGETMMVSRGAFREGTVLTKPEGGATAG